MWVRVPVWPVPCSCDDITNICRDAAMSGMRRLTEGMTTEQLLKAREAGVVGAWPCS
jgi:SpoVK/Ycf46/Vps4 family AAA+-type ATPase